MRRFLRVVSIIVGTTTLLASFAPWLCGWIIIIACSGAEYHGIKQNDQPRCYRFLKFQPWVDGDEGVRRSHILMLPDNHQITEHRIGTARGLVTKVVYYEAKYQMPDGQVRITHASGREELISHRKESVVAGFVLCPLFASIMFFAASKLKPQPTASSHAESALHGPSESAS